MTRPSTLDGLPDWVEEFRDIEPAAAVVVVGCKADLWRESRQSVLDGKFTAEGGGELSDEDKLSLQEMRQVLCVPSRLICTLSIRLRAIATLRLPLRVSPVSVSTTPRPSPSVSSTDTCCLPSIVICTTGMHQYVSAAATDSCPVSRPFHPRQNVGQSVSQC